MAGQQAVVQIGLFSLKRHQQNYDLANKSFMYQACDWGVSMYSNVGDVTLLSTHDCVLNSKQKTDGESPTS